MRLLIAAEHLGPAGGMERYLDIVLPALVARGATVHAVARRIDRLPRGVTGTEIPWADEHDAPASAARLDVLREIAAFAPDVTVAHNVMDAGVVEALRAAPRMAYHVHDHRPFCPNGDRVFPRSGRNCVESLGRPCAVHSLTDGCAYGPRRRTLTLIGRRERLRDAIAAADVTLVASRYVAERALQSAVPGDRIVEIPLPLADDAYVAPPHSAATKDDGGTARTIVFAGRVVPQKGLDSLVRAVARVPPERRPQVHAFGDGPALSGVRAEAARSGVELDAPGAVSAETLRAAIDRAAFVALPSLWAEPFGYVGIEAFARAKTVVAYDVGGVRSWLDHDVNGLAVTVADERALGAEIDALLTDAARQTRLAQHARRDAERFRLDRIAATLLRAYAG